MKTFKQAYQVLKDAEKFHLEMADFYEKLLDKAEDYRTQLLVKYLLEQERRLATNLANYSDVAKQKVMQTWLQYTHEESVGNFLMGLKLSNPPTIAELNNMAQKVDRYFSELYEAIYSAIESVEVREFFEELKQTQDKERINLSRATNSLSDI